MENADKYKVVKEEITKIYHENKGRYAYRRISAELRNRGLCFNQNHPLNGWFDRTLEGVLRAYSLKGNIKSLASHYTYRQPLKVAVFFALFSSITRKRVCILF